MASGIREAAFKLTIQSCEVGSRQIGDHKERVGRRVVLIYIQKKRSETQRMGTQCRVLKTIGFR